MKADRVRIITAKSVSGKSPALFMPAFNKIRVYFRDTGDVVYFPHRGTEVNEDESLWIEIECDREFAEANVPAQYICADE